MALRQILAERREGYDRSRTAYLLFERNLPDRYDVNHAGAFPVMPYDRAKRSRRLGLL